MIRRLRPLVVLLVGLALAPAGSGAEPAGEDPARTSRVSAAIGRLVAERMGAGVQAIVSGIRLSGRTPIPATGLAAVPLVGARLGGTAQFALVVSVSDRGRRRVAEIGRALADVHVIAPHLEAARLITRGSEITDADVIEVVGAVEGLPIAPLPTLADLAGSRAVRHIARGEVVAAAALAVPPPVRAGDSVLAQLRIDGVEASATLIASESGRRGAIVRIVNPGTRRQLRARVVARGVVEVIHG
ncbi:MAG: flagellar basal body P-ring formation protein FlgA [Acidobacteria bacterium]|nr:flagellar basal body P-ring formation protein FlgA [Acidobacteriota bacterium]